MGRKMLALKLTTRNSKFLINSHSTSIDDDIYCDYILHVHVHYLNFPWPFEIGVIIPIIYRMRFKKKKAMSCQMTYLWSPSF